MPNPLRQKALTTLAAADFRNYRSYANNLLCSYAR
jgi:hypothetical protein